MGISGISIALLIFILGIPLAALLVWVLWTYFTE